MQDNFLNWFKVIFSLLRFIIVLAAITLNVHKGLAQLYETNPYSLTTDWWYFGDSCLISFKNSDSTSKASLYAPESCGAFSDNSGVLKYYSNGNTLIDYKGDIISSSLKAFYSSSQGIMFHKLDDSIIFITTTNPLSGMYFYQLDVAKNEISLTKRILNSSEEAQATINHKNNKNIWLCLNDGDEKFYLFLIKKGGTICCPNTIEIGSRKSNPLSGDLCFNNKGTRLYSATWNTDLIEKYDFDKEAGILSNYVSWSHIFVSSIETAANDSFIYVADDAKTICQYQVIPDNIDSIVKSKITVYNPTTENIGFLQKNIDGKIYFAQYMSDYLGVINSPNNKGPLSNVQTNGKFLNGYKSRYGLPNFNASYFYTPSIDFAYTEDCWEHTYSFEGRDTFDADGYKWIFTKVNSSELLVKSSKNCVFTFQDTGRWEVSHIAYNTTRADTVTKILTIRPKWQKDVLGRDTFYCRPFDSSQGDDKFKLTLQAPPNTHCVHWNGEEPNLDETLGPIVDYDHFHTDTLQIDTAGTYIIKLTNKTFCQMWDTLVVEEKPRPSKTVVSRLGNLLSCDVVASKYRWYYNGTLQQTTDSNFLDPNQNGYWQVQLVSEFGCESELSDSFYVGYASINPITNNQLTFTIYPNPSDGHISIEVPKKGSYKIQITDLNGKVIYSTKQNLSLFATANELEFVFARGTYTLQLTDEDGKVGVKKMVVE